MEDVIHVSSKRHAARALRPPPSFGSFKEGPTFLLFSLLPSPVGPPARVGVRRVTASEMLNLCGLYWWVISNVYMGTLSACDVTGGFPLARHWRG